MKDADFDKQKNRIRKLADEWVTPIGLGWWTIDLAYSEASKPSKKNDGAFCAADCKADWEYRQATITFYMPDIADMSDETLEYCFVHELCHIFVNEMRMWGTETIESEKYGHCIRHEERVVTDLARGFIYLRDHLTPKREDPADPKPREVLYPEGVSEETKIAIQKGNAEIIKEQKAKARKRKR